jgi:methylmalonyl-CoA/ethylmalonyl-CoA epimerase
MGRLVGVVQVRRVDHVAVAVAETDSAVERFGERFGLHPAHAEVLTSPRVRLTYLDAGNMFIQLVEPLDNESAIARFLAEHGEGVHHVCFAVDDVAAAATGDGSAAELGTGRGRISAFPSGGPCCGMLVEYTEFVPDEDVADTAGWLGG